MGDGQGMADGSNCRRRNIDSIGQIRQSIDPVHSTPSRAEHRGKTAGGSARRRHRPHAFFVTVLVVFTFRLPTRPSLLQRHFITESTAPVVDPGRCHSISRFPSTLFLPLMAHLRLFTLSAST
jgi:hypothetical protein